MSKNITTARKTKVLLTGGTGFIGKNILEELTSKYSILSPQVHQLNLLSSEQTGTFFKTHGYFDIVLHTANVGGKRNKNDPPDIVYQNTLMFFNLVRNKNYFSRLINLGSGAEYGKDKPIVKIKETEFGKRIPKDYYGFSKYIIACYLEGYKIGTNLRLFGVYGKYEDPRIRFISHTINKVISKKPIIINNNVNFDYLYIDDLIKIIVYFIENNPNHTSYNIGTGKAMSLFEIAKKIVGVLKSNSAIILKQKSMGKEYSCNNQRLKREVPNIQFTPFEDTIRNMYQWYKAK